MPTPQAKTFEESRGFTLLKPTPFYNSDALAVLPAYAQEELAEVHPRPQGAGQAVTLIAAPEFATRAEGLVGLKQVYGLNPTFKPLSIGLTYTALDSGKANVADVFTTDPQLIGGKYTLLADPKFVFGYQNVAPVVSQKVLAAEGPEFAADARRGQREADDRGDAEDERRGQPRQAVPGQRGPQFLAANGLA